MDAWDFGKRKANDSEERRKSIHNNFERCSFDVRPAPGQCLLSTVPDLQEAASVVCCYIGCTAFVKPPLQQGQLYVP